MKNKKLLSNLLYIFFPRRCVGCGKVVYPNETFCKDCDFEKFRIEYPKCFYCGQENSLCSCSLDERKYDYIFSPFYYDDIISKSIRNFKFKSYLDNGKYFADEMSKLLMKDFDYEQIDVVTNVPMTKKSKRKRGFSQTEYMTKIISENIGKTFEKTCLIKTRETPSQMTLKFRERTTNLKGAFSVSENVDLKSKTVLLCDDVKTTGTTLNECSKALKKAGAKQVVCLTCALTKFKIRGEEN